MVWKRNMSEEIERQERPGYRLLFAARKPEKVFIIRWSFPGKRCFVSVYKKMILGEEVFFDVDGSIRAERYEYLEKAPVGSILRFTCIDEKNEKILEEFFIVKETKREKKLKKGDGYVAYRNLFRLPRIGEEEIKKVEKILASKFTLEQSYPSNAPLAQLYYYFFMIPFPSDPSE